MLGGVEFCVSDTKIVRNINNCTDLGNTGTGYKDISVYRNSFDALSTTLYTYDLFIRHIIAHFRQHRPCRVIFFLSMLRAWAVLNCLIWWVIVND